jgi:Mor family transcriptional regulator
MASPHPQLDKLIEQDPDLVDRIFEYILAEFPQIKDKSGELKAAVRSEFQGEECYIRGRSFTERELLGQQVLALFNGRNASEVARRLGIGRATVYRLIKQSAGKDRLSFPGNETGAALRSPTETAQAPKPDKQPWPLPRKTSSRSTPPLPAENSLSATTGARSPTDP